MEHHARAVIAVGAGVDERVDGQRGEMPLGIGGHGHIDAERVPARGHGELIGARELVAHRHAEAQHRQRHQILGEHLLLGAEAAADPLGEHLHIVGTETEDVAQLFSDEEGHLRAGADDQTAVLVTPTRATVRLQMHMLHTLGLPAPPDHRATRGFGVGDAGRDIADLAVQFGDQVARRVRDPCLRPLVVVQKGRTRRPGGLRIEYRR